MITSSEGEFFPQHANRFGRGKLRAYQAISLARLPAFPPQNHNAMMLMEPICLSNMILCEENSAFSSSHRRIVRSTRGARALISSWEASIASLACSIAKVTEKASPSSPCQCLTFRSMSCWAESFVCWWIGEILHCNVGLMSFQPANWWMMGHQISSCAQKGLTLWAIGILSTKLNETKQ